MLTELLLSVEMQIPFADNAQYTGRGEFKGGEGRPPPAGRKS